MSFQLFPPPPKKQRPINLKRPAQPASPEPAVELLERAKAPVDFHELVIKVNSTPSTPIETPPQAHVATATVGKSQPKVPGPGHGQNTSQSSGPQTRTRSSSNRSGDGGISPTSDGQTSRTPDTTSPGKEPSISGDTISPLSQADRQYTASPSFSDATTLVRNQSTATHRTKLSQISPKDAPVMRSIFPRYNPNLPLSQQQYKPTQTSPTHIASDKISRKPYSPTFYVPHANVLRSTSPEEPYYTPKIELGALWDAANGKARPEAKRTYALQTHYCRSRANNSRSSPNSSSSSPIDSESYVFGSSPVQPFYSLEQALVDSDTKACEVLISRTNPTAQQQSPKNNSATSSFLPIAHLAIQPPPAPETLPEPVALQATHITTITPKLATLAALESAAQSAHAKEIAFYDPKAEGPAAAALAAEAVKRCEELNACALLHCPVAEPLCAPYEQGKTGTYELRHPTLGAFPVVVQGDVRACVEVAVQAAARDVEAAAAARNSKRKNGKKNQKTTTTTTATAPTPPAVVAGRSSPLQLPPTTITLLNPFAAPRTSTSRPPTPNDDGARPVSPAPDEVLARLALHTSTLTIDASAIAALGTDKSNPHAHSPHPHMIDVAVVAVLAVLVAERRREGGVVPPASLPAAGSPAAVGGGGGGGEQQQQQVVYGGGQWPSGPGVPMGLMFEGPPTVARKSWYGAVGPKELMQEKVRLGSWGWWFGTDEAKEAKKAEKKRTGRKGVVDIEMGPMAKERRMIEGKGEAEAEAEGKEKEGGMHWAVELVLMLLLFAFKVAWFLLGIVFKILGRAVGCANRAAAKA